MLTFLETKSDVLAARIEGALGRADLATYVDRLASSLERNEKTHLFMEIIGFSGFDLRYITEEFGRWSPIMGKLGKLGRVAVVSDAAWLRWAARIESALLPQVSYETFRPHERDIALAWVQGERSEPHAAALSLIETSKPGVIAFELDGKITAAEIHAASERFRTAMASGQPLRVLGRIKHIGGIELEGLNAEYLQLKRDALARLERYALVGGPGWLRSWAQLLDPMLKAELRHFPAEEEAAAWAWLDAAPAAERRVA